MFSRNGDDKSPIIKMWRSERVCGKKIITWNGKCAKKDDRKGWVEWEAKEVRDEIGK